MMLLGQAITWSEYVVVAHTTKHHLWQQQFYQLLAISLRDLL